MDKSQLPGLAGSGQERPCGPVSAEVVTTVAGLLPVPQRKVNSGNGNTEAERGLRDPLVPVTLWRKGQRPRKGKVLPCNTAGQP